MQIFKILKPLAAAAVLQFQHETSRSHLNFDLADRV